MLHHNDPRRHTPSTPVHGADGAASGGFLGQAFQQAPAAERPVANALSMALARSRPISLHRNILDMVGSASAGILLSQLIYWTRRGSEVVERDGWVFKTAEQWHRETGLTWKVQVRARRRLIDLGLLEERKIALPCRLEFRLNLDALSAMVSDRVRVQINSLTLDLFRSDHEVIREMLGPTMTYHRLLADNVPHVNDAILLSRLLYAMRRKDNLYAAPTWFSQSRKQWMADCALSRDEWETARRHLRERGFLIERQCNFPRRVEMMVQADALATAMRKAGGQLARAMHPTSAPVRPVAPKAPTARPNTPDLFSNTPETAIGREWVKQGMGDASLDESVDQRLGGNGRNRTSGFPLPVSPIPSYPIPAHKDHPIPPLRIAQSRLYRSNGLQGGLQQPLQPAPARPADFDQRQVNSVVPGVVGFESTSPNPPQPAQPSASATPRPQTAMGFEGQSNEAFTATALAWPSCMQVDDRAVATNFLANMDLSKAQEMLDELAFQNRSQSVRNPTGYLRKLRKLAEEGSFVPEGAHKVAAARQHAMASAMATTTAAPVSGQGVEASRPSRPSEEITRRLAEIRAAHRVRVANRGGGGVMGQVITNGRNFPSGEISGALNSRSFGRLGGGRVVAQVAARSWNFPSWEISGASNSRSFGRLVAAEWSPRWRPEAGISHHGKFLERPTAGHLVACWRPSGRPGGGQKLEFPIMGNFWSVQQPVIWSPGGGRVVAQVAARNWNFPSWEISGALNSRSFGRLGGGRVAQSFNFRSAEIPPAPHQSLLLQCLKRTI